MSFLESQGIGMAQPSSGPAVRPLGRSIDEYEAGLEDNWLSRPLYGMF